MRDPEAVAVGVAPAITLLATVWLPLVWLLDRSGMALLWLLGHRSDAGKKVREEEIRTLVVEAENAGVLEPGEGDDRGRDTARRPAGRRGNEAAA